MKKASRSDKAIRSTQIAVVLIGLVCLLAACEYPLRNHPATDLSQTKGYRWRNLASHALSGTLVIVSASGGGTRAAPLELSVLQGLNQIQLAAGGTLATHIDILSSVSGGSVTAAYFALRGPDGFHDLEYNFIRQDGIGALLGTALPVGLVRASTPSVERIDFLIDYLEKTLFTKHETFADLLRQGARPYLVLNAADMVEGVPFPFTQNNFDLLCSDLSQTRLATAVAASAAFPVALSPVTLKNYSKCPAQAGVEWPPAWAVSDNNSNWYDNPDRASRGRVEMAYASGDSATAPKSYIHLLDGGIADNLGVSEPMRILTSNAPSPGFLDDIAQGNIKQIIFVMINARSFASSALDQKQDTPGIGDMLSATISSSIDRATVGAASKLRTALKDQLQATVDRLQLVNPDMANNLTTAVKNTKLLEVDFDAIPDSACRQRFHNISTSWTNSPNEIDSLLLVGKALLKTSREFDDALTAVKGAATGAWPSVADACASLK